MFDKETTPPPAGQETAHVTTEVAGAKNDSPDPAPPSLDEQSKQVIRAFRNLPASERVRLFDLLEKAIHNDRDLLSVGRDPGNDHYNSLV